LRPSKGLTFGARIVVQTRQSAFSVLSELARLVGG